MQLTVVCEGFTCVGFEKVSFSGTAVGFDSVNWICLSVYVCEGMSKHNKGSVESMRSHDWSSIRFLIELTLKIREWPSHSELTVPRWECPGIPLIPVIPSTVMSGHVLSLNWKGDEQGGESCDMSRGAIYVLFMVCFGTFGLSVVLMSDWTWLFLVVFNAFLVLPFLITAPIKA